MKLQIALFAFIFSTLSYASSLNDFFQTRLINQVCELSIQKLSNGYWRTSEPRFSFHQGELFYSIREPSGSYIVHQAFIGQPPKQIYSSSEKIIDIESNGEFLWIAHKEYINKLNLKNGDFKFKIKTIATDRSLSRHERIHDLHYLDQKLYVAHGAQGIVALNEINDSIEWHEFFNINQSNGHRSKVINIVGETGELIAGLDNITMPTNRAKPFNGFIKFTTQDQSQWIEAPYDRRRAGIMTYAHTTLADNIVYINNMGHLQNTDVTVFRHQKKIRPNWTPNWYDDNGIRRTAMWKGNVLIENNTAYGCSHFMNSPRGQKPEKVAKAVIQNL